MNWKSPQIYLTQPCLGWWITVKGSSTVAPASLRNTTIWLLALGGILFVLVTRYMKSLLKSKSMVMFSWGPTFCRGNNFQNCRMNEIFMTCFPLYLSHYGSISACRTPGHLIKARRTITQDFLICSTLNSSSVLIRNERCVLQIFCVQKETFLDAFPLIW